MLTKVIVKMEIVDAHQHFWKYHPVNHSWINNEMKLIQRDFLPNELQQIFEANKVSSCVSVQVDQTKEETLFQIACAESNSFIKGVVGWIDLFDEYIQDEIENYQHAKIVKGFRYVLQGAPEGFMLQPRFIENLNLLANNGYTYDLLIYNNQIIEATALLKKVPNLPIVLNHMAKPKIGDNIVAWENQIKAIAQFENLSCKISGLATEANWESWKEADMVPYLDIIVEYFGFDRIMFGSDWPVCLLATSYERWLTFLKTYFSKYTISTQEKFFSGNCTKFYKLNTIN